MSSQASCEDGVRGEPAKTGEEAGEEAGKALTEAAYKQEKACNSAVFVV